MGPLLPSHKRLYCSIFLSSQPFKPVEMGKRPLNLDSDEILPGRRNSPLALEAEAAPFHPFDLSDYELQEKIQRISNSITSGLADKLPDKGQKYHSTLLHCHDEIDRRNLARIQKGVSECQRATQAKSTESSYQLEGVGSNVTPTGSNSQGKLDKTDAAFSEELSLISHGKYRRLSEFGSQLQDETNPLQKSPKLVRVLSRELPSVRHSKQDKQRLPNLSDIGCPSISSSQAGKNLSRRLSQRRRVAAHRGSTNMEFEEVQHVVLVDDDIQPIHSTQGGDASNNWEEYKMYYPSRGDPECVELSYSDLTCLDPESYLSSPIMNFYIQYLQTLPSFKDRKGECYIFNTYFYSKLEEALTCKDDITTSFLKLRRWWRGVDIFRKAYIFLPIHGDMHWSLAIICIPAKEDESRLIILHLDSLGLHGSSRIFSIVGSYLKEEWNYINQNAPPPDLPISERIWKHLPRRIAKEKITVPQQKNEYDCGLFVLYFMKRFIEEAPERLRKKDLIKFGRKWFQPEEASAFRTEVKELVVQEYESDMLKYGIQELHASSGASENGEEQLYQK